MAGALKGTEVPQGHCHTSACIISEEQKPYYAGKRNNRVDNSVEQK